MFNRKKLQQLLFFLIFLNCCVILCITSISISTDYWVIVKPFRQLHYDSILRKNNNNNNLNSLLIDSNSSSVVTLSDPKQPNSTSTTTTTATTTKLSILNALVTLPLSSDEDYFAAISMAIEEDDALLPFDLHAKKDCKRYSGKIRFGLFKGVWLLNYAYGCKNRVNHVSIIDMLSKHKIFDQTLWISTILCCSLALFSTVVSSIFALLNVFLTPNRAMNGPISLYLWNSIAGLFHAMALTLFTIEFHLFIKKNVLTKDELESGWISTNRAQLCWSFYLLIVSIVLLFINIALIYGTVRLKRSFTNLNSQYETNTNLIGGGETCLINDTNPMSINYNGLNKINYQQINDKTHQASDANLNVEIANDLRPASSLKSSKKLKRIIDFIY